MTARRAEGMNMIDTYNPADCEFFKQSMKQALRMARSFRGAERRNRQPYAIMWRERVADYREVLIDQMRRRQGWTLAQRIAGQRRTSHG
jgi:hypothetical protein